VTVLPAAAQGFEDGDLILHDRRVGARNRDYLSGKFVNWIIALFGSKPLKDLMSD
jgi:hypothetical protein